MTTPRRPSSAPVEPPFDRTTARIESTMYLGILLGVIGVILGLIVAVQNKPAACADGEGVDCHSFPYLVEGSPSPC